MEYTREYLADAAQLASLADETPEGRSIVILAKEQFNIRGRDMHASECDFIPFTAQTRMSGIDLKTDGKMVRSIRKGSSDAIRNFVLNKDGFFPKQVEDIVAEISRQGATPLVVAENNKVLGCYSPKGYCERRHQTTICPIAENGYQNRDDHR